MTLTILFFSTIALVLLATGAAQRGQQIKDIAERGPYIERRALELRAGWYEIATVLIGATGAVTGLTWLVLVVRGLV